MIIVGKNEYYFKNIIKYLIVIFETECSYNFLMNNNLNKYKKIIL